MLYVGHVFEWDRHLFARTTFLMKRWSSFWTKDVHIKHSIDLFRVSLITNHLDNCFKILIFGYRNRKFQKSNSYILIKCLSSTIVK